MLGSATLSKTKTQIYKVPQGKKASVSIFIACSEKFIVETMATADGTATAFNYTVKQPPIEPSSVKITYKVTDTTTSTTTTYMLTDDGVGNIVDSQGNTVGTVDYTSGAISITLSQAPDANSQIEVTYKKSISSTKVELYVNSMKVFINEISPLQTIQLTNIALQENDTIEAVAEEDGMVNVGVFGVEVEK
ncbi:MAG: hypothetical protein DSY32_02670 [Aquifex sp.]|nr:MAG: hypothetical protein DSY32_02670 [Aquifex sp.]